MATLRSHLACLIAFLVIAACQDVVGADRPCRVFLSTTLGDAADTSDNWILGEIEGELYFHHLGGRKRVAEEQVVPGPLPKFRGIWISRDPMQDGVALRKEKAAEYLTVDRSSTPAHVKLSNKLGTGSLWKIVDGNPSSIEPVGTEKPAWLSMEPQGLVHVSREAGKVEEYRRAILSGKKDYQLQIEERDANK